MNSIEKNTDNKIINNTVKFSIFYLNYDKYEFLNITDLNEHKKLEVIWSILPAVILLILIGPTFSLIFSLDPDIDPVFTVKVVGHQWWWSYELSGLSGSPERGRNWFHFDFDSSMKAEEDLEIGQLRLLEVDNEDATLPSIEISSAFAELEKIKIPKNAIINNILLLTAFL